MDAERSNPMNNNLVLRHIASFLNSSADLRTCRVINKLWLTEFHNKTIKQSVIVDLHKIFNGIPNGLAYNTSTHSFDPTATIKEIVNLRISNQNELLQDARTVDFFQNKGINLNYLALEDMQCVSFSSPVHFEFLEKALFEWCPNLETLRLIGVFEHPSNVSSSTRCKNEIALKKLILDFKNHEYYVETLRLNLLGKVFESANHLECLSYFGYFYDMLLHCIPENLMTLCSTHSRMLTGLELVDVTIKQRSLTVIRNAGWHLKSFKFSGSFGEDLTARALNLFLEAYKNSLEFLYLQISWASWYIEREVEIIVHDVKNLKDIYLNVNELNVGSSGLLGNLQSLIHLDLRTGYSQFGTQHDIQTMFSQGSSKSLRSLSIDGWYEPFVNQIQRACPNVTELEVTCKASNFAALFSDLTTPSEGNVNLHDLKINAQFDQSEYIPNNWADGLVSGLSGRKLRAFTLVSSTSVCYSCPWLREVWITKWLSDAQHKYFSLEFKGFKIRVDEIHAIARLFVKSANFCKLHIILTDLSNEKCPKNLHLRELEIYQYNVEDVLEDITRRLERQSCSGYCRTYL